MQDCPMAKDRLQQIEARIAEAKRQLFETERELAEIRMRGHRKLALEVLIDLIREDLRSLDQIKRRNRPHLDEADKLI
jgi:hypothetical protein